MLRDTGYRKQDTGYRRSCILPVPVPARSQAPAREKEREREREKKRTSRACLIFSFFSPRGVFVDQDFSALVSFVSLGIYCVCFSKLRKGDFVSIDIGSENMGRGNRLINWKKVETGNFPLFGDCETIISFAPPFFGYYLLLLVYLPAPSAKFFLPFSKQIFLSSSNFVR